ncbi:hypothetical protein ACI01nite_25860 [Acetobacter cibinongensis]|uniref:Uncharacterized protein n=1 Tax=Acetobacter cibinongensis TaxID=146475 RepID=A0A0D6N6G6_9PROT|nr:hypothetical protein Abci_051_004 [Acetobacter cibinongensis]GBQ15788.1 hypothetical protein AA0482_1339 [Acetobacter cibinongensis NRIC 0482]GEL59984.1 hypothetical protein ACI01nite_25860 [Acetobacter cibinongensis]
MVCQYLPGFGKRYAATPPNEKGHFSRRLHIAEPFASRWNRQARFGSAVGDTPCINYRQKQPKVCKIEPHQSNLIHLVPSG